TNVTGGILTIVAGFATSVLEPKVTAEVGRDAFVQGANIDIKALNNYSTVGTPLDRRSRTKATAGGAAAAGAIGARATSEAKGEASTFVVSGASLSATTTDINLWALSSNVVDAEGDGNLFSAVGFGNAEGHGVLDTVSQVRLGSSVDLAARNDLHLLAGSRDAADSEGDAGDRGLIPISAGTATIDVGNTTVVSVGDGGTLQAENALKVEAGASHQSKARSRSDVGDFGGLSLGSNIRTESLTDAVTNVDVNIGAAELRGDAVLVRSRVNHLSAHADSDAVAPYQFGGDGDAESRLNSITTSDVDLIGTTIIGATSVDIVSDHPGPVLTKSDAKSAANALGADSDVTAENVTTIRSDIAATASTSITTPTLTVRSATPTSPTIEENPDQIGAVFHDGGSVTPAQPTIHLSQDIDFNAAINVAGSGPVLELDAAGNPTKQIGDIVFNTVGNTIVVDPIVNAGQLQGNVNFEMPGSGGARTLRGNTTVNRQLSYIQVRIANESPYDLQLGRIDVTNENGTVQVNRPSLVIDTLQVVENTTSGSTDITIDNAQGVTLDGDIENPNGTVSITAQTGDILRTSAQHDVITQALTLVAQGGNIGT
ncbi:MAG: hypothetical protein MI861_16390, partial [Pirellulales bacterium]|nr:hypothetical protein [Pirellulales bacterium]